MQQPFMMSNQVGFPEALPSDMFRMLITISSGNGIERTRTLDVPANELGTKKLAYYLKLLSAVFYLPMEEGSDLMKARDAVSEVGYKIGTTTPYNDYEELLGWSEYEEMGTPTSVRVYLYDTFSRLHKCDLELDEFPGELFQVIHRSEMSQRNATINI